MKNARKIFLAIIIGILLLTIVSFVHIYTHGFSYSEGRVLVVNNDTYMIIIHNSPIIMSNQTNDDTIFDELENGDEIEILHDGIQESYPGQTGVHRLKKISDGKLSDISSDVIQSLKELGWSVEEDNNGDVSDLPEPEEQEEIVFINVNGNTLATRINTPLGYTRTKMEDGSFAEFVRNYTVKEDDSPVLLYNGKKKGNQSAHVAVVELPIENADLQQCADSIMRIYAEYYYKTEQYEKIKFHFVNGFLAEYAKWREGYRISFEGNQTSWVKSKNYDDSYETFQKFMRIVFSYASTLSMDKESKQISIEDLQVGDVFLKGGSPGHVVMVIDICENEQGEKAFLLAQGYMPAQEFHVLKNPNHEEDPWYYVNEIIYPFRTPEYTFSEGSLKRLNY